jgi:hypothetical protein
MVKSFPMPLALTVLARAEAEWLLVHYEVTNPNADPVYSYDGAPGDPDQEYPDLSAHVGLFVRSGDPATVAVKRILGMPPPGKTVNVVFVPPVFRLLPGEPRSVKFKLPLPLVDKSEYSPDFPDARYERRTAKVLQLVIGYMALPPKSEVKPFPANPLAFRVLGTHGPQHFATAAAAVSVPVEARTDEMFYCP